jgi:hypothetical protein
MALHEKMRASLSDPKSGVRLVGDPVETVLTNGKFVQETTYRVIPSQETNLHSVLSTVVTHLSDILTPMNILPRDETRFLEARSFHRTEEGLRVVSVQVFPNTEAFPKKQ